MTIAAFETSHLPAGAKPGLLRRLADAMARARTARAERALARYEYLLRKYNLDHRTDGLEPFPGVGHRPLPFTD